MESQLETGEVNVVFPHDISKSIERINSPIGSVRDGIGSPVMETGQEFESVHVQFLPRNAEFVVHLSNGGILDSHDGPIGNIFRGVDFGGFHSVERVGAAGVGPDLRMCENNNKKQN